MNEWAMFYFWAAAMMMLYAMSISSPSSKILDARFKNMLRSGFLMGISTGTTPSGLDNYKNKF